MSFLLIFRIFIPWLVKPIAKKALKLEIDEVIRKMFYKTDFLFTL